MRRVRRSGRPFPQRGGLIARVVRDAPRRFVRFRAHLGCPMSRPRLVVPRVFAAGSDVEKTLVAAVVGIGLGNRLVDGETDQHCNGRRNQPRECLCFRHCSPGGFNRADRERRRPCSTVQIAPSCADPCRPGSDPSFMSDHSIAAAAVARWVAPCAGSRRLHRLGAAALVAFSRATSAPGTRVMSSQVCCSGP